MKACGTGRILPGTILNITLAYVKMYVSLLKTHDLYIGGREEGGGRECYRQLSC